MKEKNPIEKGTEIYIDSDLYKDSFDYYNLKFMDMPGVSWNWSAFVYGFLWLAYRKMYFPAAIFCLVDVVCTGICVPFPENAVFASAFVMVFHLICGLFGNAFYYLHVKKLSQKISGMSKRETRDFVRKKGGSSIPAVAIFSIVSGMISTVVEFIITFAMDL